MDSMARTGSWHTLIKETDCFQGCALFTFFIFTLKINLVFASIFGLVTTASFVLSAAYWNVANENFDLAMNLQKVRDEPFHTTKFVCEHANKTEK